MSLRATKASADAIFGAPEGRLRVTKMDAAALETGDPDTLLTRCTAFALLRRQDIPVNQLFTKASMHVLASRPPNFDWNEMLIYEVFPTDIGFHSEAADRFMTDVSVVDSGVDQRSSRWDQPLIEFNVAYGVRDLEQLQRLRAFFRVMRGRKFSFLFFDWMDHSSLEFSSIDVDDPDQVSALDQPIGVGDGGTYRFQLTKTYRSPNEQVNLVRPITKPKEGTVLVAVDGSTVANFTVDKLTGIVTFTPKWTLTIPGLHLTAISGPNFTLVSPTALPADVKQFDRITMTGWANPADNVPLDSTTVLTIASISEDRKSIVVTGSRDGWVEDTSTVVMSHHPAPKLDQEITAGFEFYVPVRFDIDKLPISLDDFGTGSASEVRLVEVRPNNE